MIGDPASGADVDLIGRGCEDDEGADFGEQFLGADGFHGSSVAGGRG